MFYKALSKDTGNMWDVWMQYDNGIYYLYSLCNSTSKGFDNISMAKSADGVHWQELGPVIKKDKGVVWMGTGSIWENPVHGVKPSFYMNYSSWKGPRQTIFFAHSEDLVHWTKCGKKNEFVQDERWYEHNGRWDCIWAIRRSGGGLYGYWTATPTKKSGGKFGFGESLDGVTWKALQPPKILDADFEECEVGAIEKIGNKYVMLLGINFHGTNHHMITMFADSPEGPFRLATKNKAFLAGHTYFARFFQTPSELLVCHHSITRERQVYLGLLKGTHVDENGVFRLTWWPGNEALKHTKLAVSLPPSHPIKPISMLARKFDAAKGFIIEGLLTLPSPLAAPRGLYIEHGKLSGTAILFDYAGRAELGSIDADGRGFMPEKRVDREMTFNTPARIRIILQGELLEVYLNDFLIECYSLPSLATGRIGLIHGNQRSSFRKLEAWK